MRVKSGRPRQHTMTHYRRGNYYRAIFSLYIDALSSPPPTPSIHLAKYWCKLPVFCKHCSVAVGMLINRKRQFCAEWDSIWNMSNGVSSRPGRLVTVTSKQSLFWTTGNEHWGNEYTFLNPSQYLAAQNIRGEQQSHYL